jgi:ribosomal protein S18 acetylase RimI-like enzyme
LESHRLSGGFDPARWKIYRHDGVDAGLLLMNDHPDQNAWEVVYLGVVPSCRGLGVGRTMLQAGLSEAKLAGRDSVLLAVDRRNRYARKLYDDLGFVEMGVRAVHVRSSRLQHFSEA